MPENEMLDVSLVQESTQARKNPPKATEDLPGETDLTEQTVSEGLSDSNQTFAQRIAGQSETEAEESADIVLQQDQKEEEQIITVQEFTPAPGMMTAQDRSVSDAQEIQMTEDQRSAESPAAEVQVRQLPKKEAEGRRKIKDSRLEKVRACTGVVPGSARWKALIKENLKASPLSADLQQQVLESLSAQDIPESLCLLVITGSHAYGLHDDKSDADLRGVFLSSPEQVLCEEPAKTLELKDSDILFHPLKKFTDLAGKGNPNVLEWLYVPDDCLLFCNDLGWMLLKNRHLFLSKAVYDAYEGFAANSAKEMTTRLSRLNRKYEGISEKALQSDAEVQQDIRKTTKHARHLLRLQVQLLEMMEGGMMHVRIGGLPEPLVRFRKSWKLSEPYFRLLDEVESRIEAAKPDSHLLRPIQWEQIHLLIAGINLKNITRSLDLEAPGEEEPD